MCSVPMLLRNFYPHRRSTFKGLLEPFVIVDLLLYLVKIKLFQNLVVIILKLSVRYFCHILRSGRMIRTKNLLGKSVI